MTKAGVGYTSLPIAALLHAQHRTAVQLSDAPLARTPSIDQPSVGQITPPELEAATIHDKLDLARERHRALAISEARQRSHTFDAGDLGSCTIRSVSNGGHSLIPIADLDQLQLHASPAVKTKELLRQFAPMLVAELRVIVAGKHSFGTQQYCVAVAPLGAALEQAISSLSATPLCARFVDWLRETFAEDFPRIESEHPRLHSVYSAPNSPAPDQTAARAVESVVNAARAAESIVRLDEVKPSAQVSPLFPKLTGAPCETSPWSRNEIVPASVLVDGSTSNPMLRVLMDRFALEKRKGDVFIEVRQSATSSGPAACSFVEPATCALAPDLLASLIAARRASGHPVTIIHPDEAHDDFDFWQSFDEGN